MCSGRQEGFVYGDSSVLKLHNVDVRRMAYEYGESEMKLAGDSQSNRKGNVSYKLN
jgi:hypothetical protein